MPKRVFDDTEMAMSGNVQMEWKLIAFSLEEENLSNTQSLLDHHAQESMICKKCDYNIAYHFTESSSSAADEHNTPTCSPRLNDQSRAYMKPGVPSFYTEANLHEEPVMTKKANAEADVHGVLERSNPTSYDKNAPRRTGVYRGPAEVRLRNFQNSIAAERNFTPTLPKVTSAVGNEHHVSPPPRLSFDEDSNEMPRPKVPHASTQPPRQSSGNSYFGQSRTKAADRLNAFQRKLGTAAVSTYAPSSFPPSSWSSSDWSAQPDIASPASRIHSTDPNQPTKYSSADSTTPSAEGNASRVRKRPHEQNSVFDSLANEQPNDRGFKKRFDTPHSTFDFRKNSSDSRTSTSEPHVSLHSETPPYSARPSPSKALKVPMPYIEPISSATKTTIKPPFTNKNTFKRRHGSTSSATTAETRSNAPPSSHHKRSSDPGKTDWKLVNAAGVKTALPHISSQSDHRASTSTVTGFRSPQALNLEEAMDWEPSEVEIQEFISVVRDVRETLSDADINFPDNNLVKPRMTKSKNKIKLMLILDSNVVMGHLKYVQFLRDHMQEALEQMVLILPSTVMRELHAIGNGRSGQRTKAEAQAYHALKWVNQQVASNHPRVKCQNAFNLSKDYVCKRGDDSILQCCLQMQEFAENVTLVTEDVNFRTKAMYNRVQAKSRLEVEAALQRLQNAETRIGSGSVTTVSGSNSLSQNDTNWTHNILDIPCNEDADVAEKVICKAKALLTSFLREVVEDSMREAYDQQWAYLVTIPPPWLILNDLVTNILVHWKTVFGKVFSSSNEDFTYIDKCIGDKSTKSYNFSLQEARVFVSTCIRTCKAIKSVDSYPEINPTQNQLKNLLEKLGPNVVPEKQPEQVPEQHTESEMDLSRSDWKLILEPLERIWLALNGVCHAGCEKFNIDFQIPEPLTALTLDDQEKKNYFRQRIQSLTSILPPLVEILTQVMEIPKEDLSAGNSYLHSLRTILTQISLEYDVLEDFPEMNSLLSFLQNDEQRMKVTNGVQELSNYSNCLTLIVEHMKQNGLSM